jgi:hypothetical protein
VATMALTPAVVDAVAPVPVIAAGGIGDGRGLAAVLTLGAQAGWLGTRFLTATGGVHARRPPPPGARVRTETMPSTPVASTAAGRALPTEHSSTQP